MEAIRFPFANSYARLPARFFARVNPTSVAAPQLISLNSKLAEMLGLDADSLRSHEGTQILAGNSIAEGSEPLAIAYAGHQFGHLVPQLGDGRANLLGELRGQDGKLYDLQLKGSGPTPFSRRGDGRAALGPVLREYVLSEAMAALGVPTTRALAALSTGQVVLRERPEPGAIFVRVAASHLRVGTFQYFAAQHDVEGLRVLADYALARHFPEASKAVQPYRALLDAVIAVQASLLARWMLLGFIHGVMNTDNMSISGETIDYGPCAFLEAYEPDKVFSSIDQQGRYAYSNQPHAAHWNLTRLAEALLPLLVEEAGGEEAALVSAREALAGFPLQYEAARLLGMRRKLGLQTEEPEDATLIEDLLDRMHAGQADFTLTFRRLCTAAEKESADADVRILFADPSAYDAWAEHWRARLAHEPVSEMDRAAAMRTVNPAVIPRNHVVQAALEAGARNDFAPFYRLLEAIAEPYVDRAEPDLYTTPARPEQCVRATFCGT